MKTRSVISVLTLLTCSACLASTESEDTEGVTSDLTLATPIFGPAPHPPIIKGPFCAHTPVQPELATDEQRVYLDSSVVANTRAFLHGYRYNDAPPTRSFPQGEGREQEFCGCQRVKLETSSGIDGEVITRPFITVPSKAPTGDYAIDLESADLNAPCPTIATGTQCLQPTTCIAPTLAVAPSYIVARTDNFNMIDNSEGASDHPAEVTFTFASRSGTPATVEDPNLIEWSGSFPGGSAGHDHFTHADNTLLQARLPLFVGPEALMTAAECQEECASWPISSQPDCTMRCSDYNARGRFTDRFEFALGGMEWDDSPSKAWGYIAGAAAAVGTCLASAELGIPSEGCGSAIGLGAATGIGSVVASSVNDGLADDDDNLGVVEGSGAVFTNNWNIGSAQSDALGGPERDSGNVRMNYQTYRVAAPRILSYSVKLRKVNLIEEHERSCDGPSDVFMEARAALHQGEQKLPASTRFPAGNGNWPLDAGQEKAFSPLLSIAQGTFSPENAPESPFLYVELALWDDDGSSETDLLGIYSDTLFLGDLINSFTGTDGFTDDGFPIRKLTIPRAVQVHGYNSSEPTGCPTLATGWDPYSERGRANIEYDIELTWLKNPPRH